MNIIDIKIMQEPLQVFLSNVEPKLANQPSSRIGLGLGNSPEETGVFDKGYTFFDGYLIGKDIIPMPTTPHDGLDVTRIQEVYHATLEAKIIVYEYVDARDKICDAKIYEIGNVDNFIGKYPQLAKKIGLPEKVYQEVHSLEDSITDSI